MVEKVKFDFSKIKTSWDLENYYYKNIKDKQIKIDLDLGLKKVDEFVDKYKNKIIDFNEEDFIEFFKFNSEITNIFYKIGLYYSKVSSLDTQNQDIIKVDTEFDEIMIKISNKMLFVEQEFKSIGYDKLIKFSKSEKLKDYKNYFVQSANSIKYILSENEEKIINLKSTSGSNAFNNLYLELTNSFSYKLKIDGEEKELTEDEVRTLRMDSNEEVRKLALKSLRETYNDKKIQITLGNTYASIVKNCVSNIKIRNYKSVMHSRNLSEELEDKTVDKLLSIVENSYHICQKYYKIKAKIFGSDKLKFHNFYAPIIIDEKKINFEDGLNIFLKTIKEFDTEFYNYSIDMFEKGRVDVFPNKGKRGGAFAQYVKDFDSFVLLNYTNKLNDVSTLAHELGHAIHGYFSQKQKSEVFNTGMSLAETASIFNEMILSKKIIPTLNDKEKISYLASNIEDFFATIFRQIQYILFERKVHQSFLDGKTLTYEDFNKLWREEQLKMTGDVVVYDVPAENECSWSMIPHIFRSPFYCYSYAFGNILSFALYSKYELTGNSFVENYKNILKAGGSETPYNLLIKYGIDINSDKFYLDALNIVETMVDDFKDLIDKTNFKL